MGAGPTRSTTEPGTSRSYTPSTRSAEQPSASIFPRSRAATTFTASDLTPTRGRSLLVRDPTGAALLAADTQTFEVEKVDRRTATAGDGDSASSVWIGAAALALLLALVAGVAGNARVRSRPQGPGARGPAPEPDPPSDPDPRVPAGRA